MCLSYSPTDQRYHHMCSCSNACHHCRAIFSSISADFSCWAVSLLFADDKMWYVGRGTSDSKYDGPVSIRPSLCRRRGDEQRSYQRTYRGCGAPASNIIPFPLISMSISQRYKKCHRSLKRRRSCLLVGKPGMGGKYQVAECSLVQQYHVAVDLLAAANCCWWFWRDIIRPLWVLIFCVILFILFSSNRVILESN